MKKTYHITVHVKEETRPCGAPSEPHDDEPEQTLPIPGAVPCTEKPRRFEKGMVVLTKDNYVCEIIQVHPHLYTHQEMLEAKILFAPQKIIQDLIILTDPAVVKEVLYRV